MNEGMSLIVKTITRLVASFIVLFGIYVAMYGHVSPGGGFAGGAIMAAGLILVLLAFGRQQTLRMATHRMAVQWDCGGALAFLGVAMLGYLAGTFFMNFLALGHPYELDSAGMIPISNAAIGAKVGAALFGVFLALAMFRPHRHLEDGS
jgi:multisubunit Na+/H+ antiporter MnhB subunit